MTVNIYKSLFGDKAHRNNPNIIGEWFSNPDGSDFQQYAEMVLGTFSTTIQNVKVVKEELEQKRAKAMEALAGRSYKKKKNNESGRSSKEGKSSWKEEKPSVIVVKGWKGGKVIEGGQAEGGQVIEGPERFR